jgi:hypothetical protein
MSDLRFQLSDFLDVESRHERTIIIRTGNFKQLLKRKIKELAVERCQDWLEDRLKRRAQMADTDYQV